MITLSDIAANVEKYLSGEIEAEVIVSIIDDAVASDSVYDYANDSRDLILKYQDMLALFVRDEGKRAESSSYYGPEQLKILISDLKREIAALAPAASDPESRGT